MKKLIIFLSMALLLCGCGASKNSEGTAASQETAQAGLAGGTDAEASEGQSEKNPEDDKRKKNEIFKHAVSGVDNLYCMEISELSEDCVVALDSFRDKVVAMMRNADDEYSLCLIDPMSMQMTDRVELGNSVYLPEELACFQDRILLYDSAEMKLYRFDGQLNLVASYQIPAEWAYTLVYDDSGGRAYYWDIAKLCIVEMTLTLSGDCPTRDIPVDGELAGAEVTAVISNKYLAISTYSEEGMEQETRFVDIKDGTLYDKTLAGTVRNFGEYKGKYLYFGEAPFGNGLFYGDMEQKDAKMLPILSYNLDVFDKSYSVHKNTIETLCVNRAGADGDICVTQYAVDSGAKKGQVAFTSELFGDTDSESYLWDGGVTAIPQEEIVVFAVSGQQTKWFVWDVAKPDEGEQTETSDISYYLDANPSAEQVKQRAKEIGDKYQVSVLVGADIADCPVFEYEYVECLDWQRTNVALLVLDAALAVYPEGMLNQLDADRFSDLYIYLCDGIRQNSELGISDAIGLQLEDEDKSCVVIDITSIAQVEETVYHEIFHAIDDYLWYVNDDDWTEGWSALNPESFSYDCSYEENAVSDNYDYTRDEDNVDDVYFIDIYSKSFRDEDMARIVQFGSMSGIRITEEHLLNKLQFITRAVRAGFDTKGWTRPLPWEDDLVNR